MSPSRFVWMFNRSFVTDVTGLCHRISNFGKYVTNAFFPINFNDSRKILICGSQKTNSMILWEKWNERSKKTLIKYHTKCHQCFKKLEKMFYNNFREWFVTRIILALCNINWKVSVNHEEMKLVMHWTSPLQSHRMCHCFDVGFFSLISLND